MDRSETMKIKLTDTSRIRQAARTVCRAFSDDPLICWLRPGASRWAELKPESLRWQCGRIRESTLNGYVIGIQNPWKHASGDGKVLTSSTTDKEGYTATVSSVSCSPDEVEMDAVAIIYPPRLPHSRVIWKPFVQLYLAVTSWLYPIDDHGNSKRIESMMESHHDRERVLRTKYGKNLWYVEVIAVNPSSQGRGLGRKIMEAVDVQIANAPAVLECTAKANVKFYEKFGFKVVLVEELRDGEEATTLWIMVRQ